MYNPIRDLWGLLYPEFCVTCRRPLVGGERTLCTWCLHDMPVVDCKDYRNNVLSELFDGLIPLRYAAALFHYRKGSRYHALLHQLKYGGRPDIG